MPHAPHRPARHRDRRGRRRDARGPAHGRPPAAPRRHGGACAPSGPGRWSRLDDYVLPRLAEPDAPAVVVVGGPTGVGKSTLVNTLVGQPVTVPGTLRPTTRSAVLVHHPDDAGWFAPERLLPTFARTTSPTEEPHALRPVASDRVRRGLAVVDAPDFDSIDEANREFVAAAARGGGPVALRDLRGALLRRGALAADSATRWPATPRSRWS
ncbi:hypothetical protein G5V59_17170 [Nocardioides sp. W3-2-3]|uniref:hypothetical protein n=1 Tax=Nocardioides convexus TaxID=2712224 RepID=UPI0024189346|nr:hypothetical protein [Nocardioides convexus]NHA01027.1 hypothetical protein [Nocardioides convexus]